MSRSLRVALVCLAALAAAGCGSEARVAEGEGSPDRGRELFINGVEGKQACGSCHTLADAGTRGIIGPNLDDAYGPLRTEHGFDESTIRDVVRGQIAYPTADPPTVDDEGTESPGMPANLVTGQDAADVAAYVASVAGLPVEDGAQPGGEATGGKAIFTQNCGSCHVLSDAGTSGTVGPNLDGTQLSRQAIARQVRNGGGGMPAFEGDLTEEQIETVSQYVADSAGG
jgi:cbb3-type cytochrome c oxidase subunit III